MSRIAVFIALGITRCLLSSCGGLFNLVNPTMNPYRQSRRGEQTRNNRRIMKGGNWEKKPTEQ
jgi:hypothetical protein